MKGSLARCNAFDDFDFSFISKIGQYTPLTFEAWHPPTKSNSAALAVNKR